jgi:hypothetical protein
MEKCNYSEGYLLIYSDTDEIHADLICEEHYKQIVNVLDDADKTSDAAFNPDPLHSWFSQTMCNEPWPYVDVKILGTVHIWCC